MAHSPVISRIFSEANRVYQECVKNMDFGDEESLAWKMHSSFIGFGEKLADIYRGVQEAIDSYIEEVGGLTDPYINPMHLHLHASVPRKSNDDWQLVIPNQDNQMIDKAHIQGRGRFHCVGLAGSYWAKSLKMRILFFTENEVETKNKTTYELPIAYQGCPTTVGTHAAHFWHAYNWFDQFDQKTVSHAVGKFYYFEKYGYTGNSKKVQFQVMGEGAAGDIYYSTALAWESDIPHDEINFGGV